MLNIKNAEIIRRYVWYLTPWLAHRKQELNKYVLDEWKNEYFFLRECRQWQLVRVGESKAEMTEQEGKDVRVNAWEMAAHRVQVERKGK